MPANTAAETFSFVVPASTTRTMPATSATGVIPACSQPRRWGLTCSIAVSTRCSRASRRLGSASAVGSVCVIDRG